MLKLALVVVFDSLIVKFNSNATQGWNNRFIIFFRSIKNLLVKYD